MTESVPRQGAALTPGIATTVVRRIRSSCATLWPFGASEWIDLNCHSLVELSCNSVQLMDPE